MAHMSLGTPSFADFSVNTKEELHYSLEKITRSVEWKPLENILIPIHSKRAGRKSYPPLVMFKCLLIQHWYSLSDYELEKNIDDRLSFRRFIGIGYSESVPDHSSFCNFRNALQEMNLYETLFIQFNRQLEKKGIIMKQGTMIDASMVEADAKKPSQNKDGSSGRAESDTDARWGAKGRKKYFGYKMHVGVDMHSLCIRSFDMTAANVHDHNVFSDLITKDEKWVFADKAYESRKHAAFLSEHNINNGLMFRPHAGRRTLSKEQTDFNAEVSKVRSPMEGVFGILKRHYNYQRVRYRNMMRNRLELCLKCLCYNMRKLIALTL